MAVSRVVELDGHIIDSGMMQSAFSIVMDLGGEFDVEEFDIGRRKDETSYARLRVTAEDEATLDSILHELHQNGANPADPDDAELTPAPGDQVVPERFYSTTNHPTQIRYDGEWLTVEEMEMDCAVVVDPGDDHAAPRAHTKVLNAVDEGDLVVTGERGIRVQPPERPRDSEGAFGFMEGGVSSERPSETTIRQVAEAIEETKREDGNVLVVAGPALIHTGAREALAALVREGYVDGLSTGNGFAVHDLERDLFGTSLGVNTETADHARKGHKHHIYTISEIIRAGGIREAVDDGPLPDTITDAVEAQNAIREQAHDADMVLMLSTLLHSVAVGNCLPSTTRVVCVDINPATVTQLLDRGSAQAVGMVTDIGTFVPTLADELL